ncbi:MAG: condensation domain-containing protein, partial [Rhizobacter sp.]
MNRRDILTAYKQGLVSTEEVIHRLKSMAAPHGLSEGQKGLWWLARMQPDSSAYHVPFGWALQGSGDAGFWQQVLDALVKQHPMLDSLIRVGPDGEATQVEAASGRARLQEHDIRTLAPDEVLPYLRRLVRQPMALQDGPPMRVHLLHRETEHIVLLVVHHIVCDGQSFQLLAHSLMDIASRVERGEAPKILPPAAGYADFVSWERALLASDAGSRHLAYWRGQLAQPLPVLELPGDLPRHLSQRDQGRTHGLRIDDASRQRIRVLASQLRVSPAVFFLAVYKLLLQRYSAQRDLIVGVPNVGRPEPRFEQLVGYFINMVPVRSRIDPQESFAHFARALQLTLADGLEHAAYPFAALVRNLKVPRHAGQSPIFQVAYEYQSASVVGEASGGASDNGATAVRRVQGLNQEGEYELVLEVLEHTDGFGLNIKHDPQLFSAGYIDRLGKHLLNLVQSVLDEPQLALHRHGMLGPDERRQLLVDWNRTGSDYPRQQCTHELFAKQARYTPDAPALSFQDGSLSYRELDSRANGLA